jgi:adenosylhomocysteine nucleosidase
MIAIIGAMREEVKAIEQRMTEITTETIAGHNFMKGKLSTQDVVLFESGIGLVNAAIALTLASQHYPLTTILNVGTAGGLHPDLKVLDLIAADQLTYHDFDISVFGNPRSFSPENRMVFKADPRLLKLLTELNGVERLYIGPLVSGQQFISTEAQVAEILAYYPEALAAEMEGAALAHVASKLQIPFLVIRSISDLVIHPHNEMTFDAYLHKASERSAQLCEQLVSLMN